MQLQSNKQTVTLLKQDKDFLTKQTSDLSNKLSYAEERLRQSNEQLDRAKMSREELYEKYVASRYMIGSFKWYTRVWVAEGVSFFLWRANCDV